MTKGAESRTSGVSACLVGKGAQWVAFVMRKGKWWRVEMSLLSLIPRIAAAVRQTVGLQGIVLWVCELEEQPTQNLLLMIQEDSEAAAPARERDYEVQPVPPDGALEGLVEG